MGRPRKTRQEAKPMRQPRLKDMVPPPIAELQEAADELISVSDELDAARSAQSENKDADLAGQIKTLQEKQKENLDAKLDGAIELLRQRKHDAAEAVVEITRKHKLELEKDLETGALRYRRDGYAITVKEGKVRVTVAKGLKPEAPAAKPARSEAE